MADEHFDSRDASTALSRLEEAGHLPPDSRADLFSFAQGLRNVPASQAPLAETVASCLVSTGWPAFETAILGRCAERAGSSGALTASPAFAEVAIAFFGDMRTPYEFPAEIARLVGRLEQWNSRSIQVLRTLEGRRVHQQVVALDEVIGGAIRLQHDFRTRRLDDWLASAPRESADAFESWREGFFDRCDALGAFASDALIRCDLVMPEEGVLKAMLANARQLGHLIGGQDYALATPGFFVGLARVFLRERRFFGRVIGRQLRMMALPIFRRTQARNVSRLNARAGFHLIGLRHAEELRAAFGALKQRGVVGERADALVLQALFVARGTSGKPWKGLVRLTDLIVHSGLDPRAESFPGLLIDAMSAAVDYTHLPWREWIVLDYGLGKLLLQIDGKIGPGEHEAGLQQGRGSLAAGTLRAGARRTEFGRRYSKPLGAFLDSMVVAEGAAHQRQRKAFLPFFTQQQVLEHTGFIEDTVARLLDRAAEVAARQDGGFDFRRDFAYQFPIQVICHMMDLPAADVPSVQHWAESSVRAMDTDAGVSLAVANRGQRASDDFRHYLQGKLDDARAGRFRGRIITSVAEDASLSEAERIANLGVIIFAGFETTTGLLAKGMQALLQHRVQWDHLQQHLVVGPEVAVQGERLPDRELRWFAWAASQLERRVDRARRARIAAILQASYSTAG